MIADIHTADEGGVAVYFRRIIATSVITTDYAICYMTMIIPNMLNRHTPSSPTIISPPDETIAAFGLEVSDAAELD